MYLYETFKKQVKQKHNNMTNNNAPPPIELEDLVSAIKKQMDSFKDEQPKRVIHLPLTEANYPAIIPSLIIGDEDFYPEQVAILSKLEKQDKMSDLLNKAAFAVLGGKQKSAKTRATYLMVAALVQQNVYNGVFYSKMLTKKKVVIFDTEQSPKSCWDGRKTIKKLLQNSEPMNNLTMISLRRFSYSDRLIIIERYLSENQDIGAIVIDGIRDLVSDPNNGDEANKIATLLLRLSTELNVSILVVVHMNKNDTNLRGHLGSELVNKADTVIGVEKDGDFFKVTPIACRSMPFTPFAFSLDNDGVPVIEPDFDFDVKVSKSSSKATATVDPNKIDEAIHREALVAVMSLYTTSLPGWGDLVKALVVFFDKKSIKIGGNKIREFVAHYLAKGWLIKQPVAGRSYPGYQYVPSAGV